MNLSYVYEHRHLLSDEALKNFRPYRKKDLSIVEYLGLEAILCKFVEQYEEETLGESYCKLADYTRWNKDGISILDGRYDTYEFDGYAIDEIWMTDNGCVLLDCYELKHPEYEEYEDILNCTDWPCECKPVTFRLD